jgi:hypothetical protein
MIERVAPGASNPAASGFSGARPAAPPKAGSLLAIPLGQIAGDVRAITATKKDGKATYELLVANETAAPVATFAYAADPNRAGDRKTWNAIVVPPHSAIAVTIDVEQPKRSASPRFVAEIYADSAQLTLDGGPPLAPPPSVTRRIARGLGLAALVATVAVGIVTTRPHVLALAAPDAVPGGVPFDVAYALGAASHAEYVLQTPDGLQIRRGTLSRDAGAFVLKLPETTVSTGYDLRVSARGAFGADAKTTHIVALPPAGTPAAVDQPAHVVGATLEKDAVRGGDPIVVNYRVAAETGAVRLIDEQGTVRAEALLSPRGHSTLVAPYVDADQDFRVVVNAERGNTHDEASLPVTILRGAPRTTAVAPVPAAATATTRATRAANAPGGPIEVGATQVAGQPIVVTITHAAPGLHVALMGDSSNELVGADADDSADGSLVLAPPPNLVPGRYSIVATFNRGYGQETVIRPITIAAP